MSIDLLIVCSGPPMYLLYNVIEYDSMDDLRKELPEDIYDYVIRHDLIYYDTDDTDKEYPSINRNNLPSEYIQKLVDLNHVISYTDLYNYKYYIVKELKDIHPNLKEINYTSVDPIYLSPKLYGDNYVFNIINTQNTQIEKELGVKLNFIDHHTETFQKYIKHNDTKFDIVWFLTCSQFNFVIDTTLEYINNFRKIIKYGGVIVHMDWDGKPKKKNKDGYDQPVSIILDIVDRHKKLSNHKEYVYKINFILAYLKEIKSGIYMFKKDYTIELLDKLL